MKAREHLYLFYLATTCWTFFFLGGLWSDYYRTWPAWRTFLLIDALPAAALGVLSVSLIRWMTPGRPYRGALWIAFYFTVPLLVYDLIYLGLYKQLGFSFIVPYWYLSIFYVIPWLVTFGVVAAGAVRPRNNG